MDAKQIGQRYNWNGLNYTSHSNLTGVNATKVILIGMEQTEEKEIKVKREFVENEFEDIKTEEKEIKVKREFGEEIKKKIKDNV
ncbi:hypothetical protein RIR_jg29599.t1 [Rhizophagus irregularis DAOM 181602=DAOM 197198]|nr:hypothetical protein RIR_jg29599.t1 [Rhizophagus irregularis DAOM 181602=DAOM 197198]